MRRIIGIAFLLLQAGSVVNGQFRSHRWYCWAPNDYAVWYRIEVQIGGIPLTPSQVEQRYQIDAEHVYQNPAQNLMEIIQQRETTYGHNDRAKVNLHYRVDGSELREWRWPPQ